MAARVEDWFWPQRTTIANTTCLASSTSSSSSSVEVDRCRTILPYLTSMAADIIRIQRLTAAVDVYSNGSKSRRWVLATTNNNSEHNSCSCVAKLTSSLASAASPFSSSSPSASSSSSALEVDRISYLVSVSALHPSGVAKSSTSFR